MDRRDATGVLITGTDTGVGKTVVGCGLAAALSARGKRVGVLKPAETGCPQRPGGLYPQDARPGWPPSPTPRCRSTKSAPTASLRPWPRVWPQNWPAGGLTAAGLLNTFGVRRPAMMW